MTASAEVVGPAAAGVASDDDAAGGEASRVTTDLPPPALLDRRWMAITLGVAGLLLVAVVWDVSIRLGWLPEEDMPGPIEVAGAFADQVHTTRFWTAVRHTVTGAWIGLGIAFLIALVVGVAMGTNEYIRRALRPLVEFLRPVPSIALVPMAIVIWGPTTQSSTFLVAFACTWVLIVQVIAGVASVDDTAAMTARSFGLTRVERLRWLTLPSAMPFVMTGLRICTGISLVISVAAELIIGTPGIGSLIRQEHNLLALDRMYALVVAAGVLGIVAAGAIGLVERYVLRWQPTREGSAA